ncbi:MAG TPA: hypothetical protein VMB20_12055 [Candidatus Acidoferrum sp.]|nr:hypothetical protein [Candidatus Acidoferrum sp.]
MATALVAAAIADPLVETIANTGMLGRGYSDNDHTSVLPTLIAGAALLLVVIVARCFRLLHRASAYRRWAVGVARHIAARPSLADLPYILSLQFVALFAMESSEQFLRDGRLLGGAAWLGGPIWFSVFMHVLIGWICTMLVARAMRSIVRRCAALVSIALDLILCAFKRSNTARFTRRRDVSIRCRAQTFDVRQLGERAPPLLPITLA